MCVIFGVCVCVCVSGMFVDHNRSLFSLTGEKSFHAHRLGRVLGLTRDSPPYLLVKEHTTYS